MRLGKESRERLSLRPDSADIKVTVHMGTCGIASGARGTLEDFQKELEAAGRDDITLATSGCAGLCSREPMATVEIAGNKPVTYVDLTQDKVSKIFSDHVIGGKVAADFVMPRTAEDGFFSKQKLIALANRGVIDPEKIEDYLARDGYQGAARALSSMTAEEIITEVEQAGLRGRGGAGFPTGKKWRICYDQPGDEKYLICNADEGDPGAFMDRSLVESDPHGLIEGMIIAAKAIGAHEGFIYLRNEYPLALQNILLALEKAREYGLLGENIFGSGFSFDISVHRGAGAFVCGEETSLINSLEGSLPQPRVKPPYPAQAGYMGKPTNINNVETFANVPHIIRNGAQWFSSVGTENSKGTKVFSLVGKINNSGLVEVPMGISLREIIFDIGEGVPDGRAIKAVQTGGPSGGCIPADMLDISVDYESLTRAGCIMGSGGMIVMDETTCMVEVARYFLSFTQEESCGKCVPCRIGTKRMLEILTGICEGHGESRDLEMLEEMAHSIKDSALCGLGQTAPNPVLTTLKYFRHEYEAHINEKRCPAGVCKALIRYEILPDPCTGCHACFKVCPVDAISGEPKKVHEIDQDLCIRCGKCEATCRFDAIRVV